jgi:small subunit ribosomal protein S8
LNRADTVEVVYSKLNEKILNLLSKQGYIRAVKPNNQFSITVELKYYKGESVIRNLVSVSKPSRRVYVSHDSIPQTKDGIGLTVLTTSKGILTKKEAEEQKVGGQVLMQIW